VRADEVQVAVPTSVTQEMEIGILDSHRAHHIGASELVIKHSNGPAWWVEPLKKSAPQPPPE
jgi:hypothetical protein